MNINEKGNQRRMLKGLRTKDFPYKRVRLKPIPLLQLVVVLLSLFTIDWNYIFVYYYLTFMDAGGWVSNNLLAGQTLTLGSSMISIVGSSRVVFPLFICILLSPLLVPVIK